jgi:hypothetical protein
MAPKDVCSEAAFEIVAVSAHVGASRRGSKRSMRLTSARNRMHGSQGTPTMRASSARSPRSFRNTALLCFFSSHFLVLLEQCTKIYNIFRYVGVWRHGGPQMPVEEPISAQLFTISRILRSRLSFHRHRSRFDLLGLLHSYVGFPRTPLSFVAAIRQSVHSDIEQDGRARGQKERAICI